jgi:putative transposase
MVMENNRDVEGEGVARLPVGKPHLHAAIVFGSAASHPARRPASVRATCEAIGLARSTYYYQSHRSSGAIALEQKIVQRLLELRESYPNDGYRRMTRHLQLEGLHVNRKRIARLMQLHNLSVRTPQQDSGVFHYRRQLTTAGSPRENVHPTAADQVWVSDLAYVHIASGLIYTAGIIDMWSREVVGYAASTHINPRLPALALHSAVRARRPALGCIHHSTYGIQYLMRGYRELLRKYGLIPVVNEAAEAPMVGAPLCTPPGLVRKIVDVPGYKSWDEVVARTAEFVGALYSQERIEAILGARFKSDSSEGPGAVSLSRGGMA